MKILALEPYFGGSHKAFLDGWSIRSRHEWTLLGLPAYKWKWRMRHSAVTLAREAADRIAAGGTWDIIFCSDMLNLAEFMGLAPPEIKRLPTVVYFHENQLSYPVRYEHERDYHFAAINMTTALCADKVWFNSDYHKREFCENLRNFLKRMPDYQHFEIIKIIEKKSSIYPQGIEEFPVRKTRTPGPARILWAARWEYDKDPETFFKAIEILQKKNAGFRISVIGEQFKNAPGIFDRAKKQFAGQIDRWGYQKNRKDYISALTEADIMVSTAQHEFFGVSVVEATAAGAYPVLPKRLSYPEIIDPGEGTNKVDFFYEGGRRSLTGKLSSLIGRLEKNNLWQGDETRCIRAVERFYWKNLVPVLDNAIEK